MTVRDQIEFMRIAIQEAKKCRAVKSAFNVGAVLVQRGEIVATGYSREMPGNTHAEECCLLKIDDFEDCVLYSTMEPCGQRLSGKECCANLIIKKGIKKVVYAVKEPETFVGKSKGVLILSSNGIEVVQEQDEQLLADTLELNSHLT